MAMKDNDRCPVPHCSNRVRSKQLLMCRSCWFRVPKELRDRVWTTWRLYLRQRQFLDLLKDYKDARNAAIAAAAGVHVQANDDAVADVGRDVVSVEM